MGQTRASAAGRPPGVPPNLPPSAPLQRRQVGTHFLPAGPRALGAGGIENGLWGGVHRAPGALSPPETSTGPCTAEGRGRTQAAAEEWPETRWDPRRGLAPTYGSGGGPSTARCAFPAQKSAAEMTLLKAPEGQGRAWRGGVQGEALRTGGEVSATPSPPALSLSHISLRLGQVLRRRWAEEKRDVAWGIGPSLRGSPRHSDWQVSFRCGEVRSCDGARARCGAAGWRAEGFGCSGDR